MQAAINAARSQLPSYLPQNPSYRKANPADSPILILTLTSDVVPKPQIYDMADSILAQKMSQIQGVGQVFVGGSSSPAVRVELNPLQLANNGVGLEAVRTALAGANANRPKGAFQDGKYRWAINDNDQIFKAEDYAPIIVGLQPADRRGGTRGRPGHGHRQRLQHSERRALRASTPSTGRPANCKTPSC